MKLLLFFVLASFIFNLMCTDNASQASLKLQPLINEVIKRNPELAATRKRVKAATIAIPRVQILDDPQFLFRTISNTFGPRREFIAERRYKFIQTIPFPGKLRIRGEIAEQQRDILYNEEITTYQELIVQTKRLYFLLFLNQTAHQINRQNRIIISRFIDSARALYKTARGPQSNVYKAHIELQLLDEELLVLDSEQETFIAMINALLDRAPSNHVGKPEESFHPVFNLDYNYLESIAIRERPELHGIQAMIGEEEARARLARQEYYPDFIFELMIQSRPSKNKNAWGINIGFNIPIWINQKQKREVQEAEAKALAHTFAFSNLRAIIRGRIKEILAKINAAEERIILYKTAIIPTTIKTLASQETNYREGKETFLILLDTRRQLQNNEFSYERVRVEREILLAELEREIGAPLEKIIHPKPAIANQPILNIHNVQTPAQHRLNNKKIVQLFDELESSIKTTRIAQLNEKLWGTVNFNKREFLCS